MASLLSGDLWRAILLRARGELEPASGRGRVGNVPDLAAWIQWWALVARVSSTCHLLRNALLGPAAGSLWRYVCLFDAFPGMRDNKQQCQGLRRLLHSQARHAHCALLWSDGGWQLSELAACAAALTSLQELELHYIFEAAAPCIAGSLGSLPASVCCFGADLWSCLSPAVLSHVTRIRVTYPCYIPISAADVQGLATRLPRLQVLELCLGFSSCASAAVLGLLPKLPKLPPVSLQLELEIAVQDAATAALRQLVKSRVQLQSLRFTEGLDGALLVEDLNLLAQLRIGERLVVCFCRRLQQLPPIAEVRYERAPSQ